MPDASANLAFTAGNAFAAVPDSRVSHQSWLRRSSAPSPRAPGERAGVKSGTYLEGGAENETVLTASG